MKNNRYSFVGVDVLGDPRKNEDFLQNHVDNLEHLANLQYEFCVYLRDAEDVVPYCDVLSKS